MMFLGQLMGAVGQASSLDYMKRQSRNKARMTRANGQGAKNKAYADAAGIENAARLNAELDAQAERQARKNQTQEVASARAARSASGFLMSEGTGGTAERDISEVYDNMIANMAQSSSIASINAQQRAIDTRRSGDAAMRKAEIEAMGYDAEAQMYRTAAKNMRSGIITSALTGIVGAGFGAYEGYQAAGAAGMSKTQGALAGGMQGSGIGWDMGSMTNPMMAPYTVDAEGSFRNVMSWLTPRQSATPQAAGAYYGNEWEMRNGDWYIRNRVRQ